MALNEKIKVSAINKNYHCEQAVQLKKQYISLKERLDNERKFLDKRKEANFRMLSIRSRNEKRSEDFSDANISELKQQYISESLGNSINEPIVEEKKSSQVSFSILSPIQEGMEKEEIKKEKYSSRQKMEEKSENGVEKNMESFMNLKELNSCGTDMDGSSEDKNLKRKIKKLLKLIYVLKEQLNQKDTDIYRLEAGLPMKNWDVSKKKKCSDNNMIDGNAENVENVQNIENVEKMREDDLLFEKMKNMLIIQHEDIAALKEKLGKKNRELHLLKNENELKDEILVEARKDLEKNYALLTNYKNKVKEYEQNFGSQFQNVQNCLDFRTHNIEEKNLHISENKLNIRMQKKVILALNEELKKRDETICELRNIIENVGLNNNRDIIKYKQSNVDLLNKLNLNSSLLNSQKMEIENLHINFKQLEEDLKKKDEEIKKLHETILDVEEENSKLKTDVNKFKFDVEIKNVNLINLKKKIKTIRREHSIDLKKQKERFMNTLNEECKERDKFLSDKSNEFEKLIEDYRQLKCVNEELEKYVEELNKKILKKEEAFADIQDKLLDCQAKMLVYENNNELKTLRKNEEYLRKKLDEQMYRNEQLITNSVLLKKSTVENYALEKQILELKGSLYAKDEEIKKLKEMNSKKRNSFSSDENYGIQQRLYHNGLPLKPVVNLSNSDSANYSDLLLGNSKYHNVSPHKFIPCKDDPVDLAIADYLSCLSKNKSKANFVRIQKLDTNVYSVNGKRVVIRFLNGELFVEDNSYPIQLHDYLLQLCGST